MNIERLYILCPFMIVLFTTCYKYKHKHTLIWSDRLWVRFEINFSCLHTSAPYIHNQPTIIYPSKVKQFLLWPQRNFSVLVWNNRLQCQGLYLSSCVEWKHFTCANYKLYQCVTFLKNLFFFILSWKTD